MTPSFLNRGLEGVLNGLNFEGDSSHGHLLTKKKAIQIRLACTPPHFNPIHNIGLDKRFIQKDKCMLRNTMS